MNKKIFAVLIIFFTAAFTTSLLAQEISNIQKTKTKSNQSNDKMSSNSPEVCKVKIQTTPVGCEIIFTNEVITAREAGSGMATGRRMHKPIRITKELDKSSPLLAKSSSSGGGAGKVSVSDLSVTIRSKGQTRKIPVMNNEFTLPEGIDDDCDMVLSWSWGMSNSRTTEQCELPLKLTLENGACLAINSKGVSAK